jgi:hypothetical protein
MLDDKLQYYPYERVQSDLTLPALESVPKLVRDYLMDMPQKGYAPPDNNESYRCRLMKYLYYDGKNPLSNPLPTPAQKMSLVYDPDNPDKPPTDKQYRIFTQQLVHQAQTHGVTTMRIYMGRVIPVDAYKARASIVIEFLTNAAYDSNTKTTDLSRTFAMACLAERALSGVNMSAGATFAFNRQEHPDSNIQAINDETTNVGYRLTMGLTFFGSTPFNQ